MNTPDRRSGRERRIGQIVIAGGRASFPARGPDRRSDSVPRTMSYDEYDAHYERLVPDSVPEEPIVKWLDEWDDSVKAAWAVVAEAATESPLFNATVYSALRELRDALRTRPPEPGADPRSEYMNLRTCVCGADASAHKITYLRPFCEGFDPDWDRVRARLGAAPEAGASERESELREALEKIVALSGREMWEGTRAWNAIEIARCALAPTTEETSTDE